MDDPKGSFRVKSNSKDTTLMLVVAPCVVVGGMRIARAFFTSLSFEEGSVRMFR